MRKLNLEELARQAHIKEPLADLYNYSSMLTVSQAVKYFERAGLNTFTKTMIQNYVRVGVVPPPSEKRYYIKEHMMYLVLVDRLKVVYSLEEIRKSFQVAKETGISIEDAYVDFWNMYEAALYKQESESIKPQSTIIEPQCGFFEIWRIMANTVAAKTLVQLALEKYFI